MAPTSAAGRPGPGGGRTERDRRQRVLSQNFLRLAAATRFINLFRPVPGALCLEVGAGRGVVTEQLSERVGRLVAYELDPAHAAFLRTHFADRSGVHVVAGDFLRAQPPREPFQVVGNVPFGRTSDIVRWCLDAEHLIDATLVTQAEYARKRTGRYGRWTLVTVESWPWFTWELLAEMPRQDFRPVPAVDAAVLRLARREDPLAGPADADAWLRLVRTGFRGVCGSLRASLISDGQPPSRVVEALREAGLERSAIVADASPEQWLVLFRVLGSPPHREPRRRPGGLPPSRRRGRS